MKRFSKILIANRGEIALRIHRACREMGIQTVAVHSTADSEAMHVRLADESVCLGPPSIHESYLNIPAILSAATITRADAIHPGVGFLSENAQFAKIVDDHGFIFIGPHSDHIRLMGNKIEAKSLVSKLGIPVIPGSKKTVGSLSSAKKLAQSIGYPVMFKAVSGGGGRGLTIVNTPDDMSQSLTAVRNESYFALNDQNIYIEKYLSHPRHIEIQVLGDSYGNIVHFGERDCSIQRRYQKLIEEAPCPILSPSQREDLGRLARKIVQEISYVNLGTLEFLYQDNQFYFIEMNTRLQVEHPITEMISGIDLVQEQIRIASQEQLGYRQEDIRLQGHAIECRINAEQSWTFLPSPGRITRHHAPGGFGVRVDSALYDGYAVPPHYDSLISKLIAYDHTREKCVMKLKRALSEYVIEGIDTVLPFHQWLMEQEEFLRGEYDIRWLERRLQSKES